MTDRRTKGGLVAIGICTGLWLIQNGVAGQDPPRPSSAEAFGGGSEHVPRSTVPPERPLRPSEPVRIRIPAVQVDAPLMRLGLGPDGSLDVPPAGNRNLAGWYKDGTPPGARGTAVVAGHVDNARGPAVFYHLGSQKKGHTVEVVRKDGRTAVFTIDAIEVYDSEDFPEQRVYAASGQAELRVITCGGTFSEKTGYRGNVVAYAHLTAVR
ncbi:class F sortase [Streptomyces agglomeratus]|uniref:class F sortase n=1 Tax=Streptomyces agglomeratus TaxID=285458 RepID=UPI000854752C|nr:class F sortase [Streptomyces agglomeratus]OEJ51493.1 class F sortase [Streptomyces agglomeratus]OEJ58894.1 class F sortase [Streptomyces agglomeratus]